MDENSKIRPEFKSFPSIGRLSRTIVITEKLDGTNASITITEDGQFLTGSRTRWITPGDDNYGFSKWANENKEELMKLGVGTHFGEWWGQGIQRGYGIKGKRFSLFNTHRWECPTDRPACAHCVPVLYQGPFDTDAVDQALHDLDKVGSAASPGFMRPEGIVVFHTQANVLFKKTLEQDEKGKSHGA